MVWLAMTRWWRTHVTLRLFSLLSLGQAVSAIMAVMSLTSSLIADLGVNAPLSQSMFNYLALALVYGSILIFRRQKTLIPWYWYLLLGFVDVQGNYLVNEAYQYSSITSVTLLDCWTILWAMILTWFIIGTRYSIGQYFGAVLCVLGLGLVLLSDAGIAGGGGTKPILGDVLVIGGTLFYAMSNVGEEFCVKKKDRVEVVAMIGVYGFLVTVVEASIIELKNVESIEWSTDLVLSLVGYTASSFLFYTLAPFVLKLSGAAMFNLSLLTSDMWAVVFKIYLYHQKVDWLYFLSFAIVVIGLVIYSTTEKDHVAAPSIENGSVDAEYQVLQDESTESRNESSG
ncbi:uncharacterized protein LOC129300376 [Prosopis cineraria]|uniref:uncharacterized protein LOC129300376 n=1 Tax=Prosopis cineraria TaxID=364024 RepID=UPI00240F99B4|nr:uncharacterized protein LOC129300376 [Prosopis cineraria]